MDHMTGEVGAATEAAEQMAHSALSETEMLAIPVAAMVLWTVFIAMAVIITRFVQFSSGKMDVNLANYYELYRGENPSSGALARLERNFENLLQTPMLFYAATLLVMALHMADGVFVIMAWVYVSLRVVHSAWQITINHVFGRLFWWVLSILVTGAILVRFLLLLLG